MSATDLTLERWRALDRRAAELLAATVARAVGGELLGVRWPRSHAPALRVARIAVRRCFTAGPADFDEVVAGLAAAGRRLLTPDEWEYAGGLGRGTLFPWGDRMPAPRDPEAPTGLNLGDLYWPS